MGAKTHFLRPGLGQNASPCQLFVEGSATPSQALARTIEWAVDSPTRKRGLLGRASMDSDTALIIAPSSGVHTFGMQFPIDVIFAARDGRILKIREAMPRSRIALSLRAFAVVEMAAGSARRSGLRPGDRMVVRPTRREN
jgi:uncharacterized membrane protein (UPF0127 family)